MGFLHKLWDETVAGPTPENGLGKLRKQTSLPFVRSSRPISGENVTRSITILKKLTVDAARVPDSAVGSSDPDSPLTPGTPSETHATSLNACDWVVLNALDR